MVYLAYQTFFSSHDSTPTTAAGVDISELEKSLRKILESQNAAPKAAATPAAAPASADPFDALPAKDLDKMESAPAAAPANPAADVAAQAELEKLRLELNSKSRMLDEMKKLAGMKAPGAAAGANPEELKALNDKIKDLESRLAEYEIISEDIADLSFFKEENRKLQDELAALRGGAPAPATPAESAPADAAPSAETPAVEAAVSPEAVAADVQQAVSMIEDLMAPPPTETPAAPAEAPKAEEAPAEKLKEEASAAPAEGEPAKDAAAEAPVTPEDSQLLNQFENFVKKG